MNHFIVALMRKGFFVSKSAKENFSRIILSLGMYLRKSVHMGRK